MKKWNSPVIEEVEFTATSHGIVEGPSVDNWVQDGNGKWHLTDPLPHYNS